ncbi:MAG: VTT domain-containing protein [Bacteroidetes bacterium]|nr:VTT domain-containing protein [Bacteroidota bacterium]
MSFLHSLLDFILHINDHLDSLVAEYGNLIYGILFAIIFVETGIVIMPFLPGDSLLFAAGAICARSAGEPNAPMNILVLIVLLSAAAILGDNSNYAIGRFLGTRAVNLKIGKKNLVKQAYIEKTHSFFEKYGTKAIIMARFVPIIRTFTPFVAGVGKMNYKSKFLPFDVVGGILWISTMPLSGYFLGTNEWVKKHFEIVVVAIILISVLPMVIAFLNHKFSKKKS